MKKLLLIVVFIIFGFANSYTQGGIRIGLNVGVPMSGDADNI